MHSVLVDLGVDGARASAEGATGGPFVPIKAPQAGASAFERQLYRINVARAQIDRYSRTLISVPVRKPVIGEVDMSSPFGMRMDPFLGRPAIHTGIDLRGESGEPVRATATGQRHDRRPRRRLRQPGGNHPRQRPRDALRPSVGNQRENRASRAHRRSRRPDRLDRPLHRPAPAL